MKTKLVSAVVASKPIPWPAWLRFVGVVAFALAVSSASLFAQAKKPNILVIWGDDIGYWNISAYNQGMMGYKTPNIDRIAKEGALFTDWYGQQSCTAGRAAFITGQSGFRTGMLKVGLPGAKEGLKARDVTIAELLKAQGYKTGQFGKNHLGDRDEHLPTAHGFDEFFGSLYHLNAEDEPEHPDYFKDPEMRKKYGTRGVIHTWANPDGTQKIESTGPLNKKRMETIDEEVTKEALRFMEEAKKADKPFFLWWNSTRMHIWTQLKTEAQGKTGLGIYPDGMVEHDGHVGQVLDKLKELGLDENTIVMYSTDNGAEKFTWPDGGRRLSAAKRTRTGKAATACRAPSAGPASSSPARSSTTSSPTKTCCPRCWPPRVTGCEGAAAQGHEGRRQDLQGSPRRLQHHRRAGRQVAQPAPRVLLLQRRRLARRRCATTSGRSSSPSSARTASMSGRSRSWRCACRRSSTCARDPFETADHEGMDYEHWRVEHLSCSCPAQEYVGKFLATFKEFPPSQKASAASASTGRWKHSNAATINATRMRSE